MGIIHELQKRLMLDYFEVETNDDFTADEKVRKIINITCIGCAGVAATPIPVADFFLLTPIQGYMGYKIARVRGVSISRQGAVEIAKEILGVVGLGLLARQIAVSTLKFIPLFGSIANIPVVYGLTFAIGRVMDYYFTEKAAGREISHDTMKEIFGEANKTGEKAGEVWAKAQAQMEKREKEITRSFLQAKDRFVKEARETFEKTYQEFIDHIAKAGEKPPKKPKTKKAATNKAAGKKRPPAASKPRVKKTKKAPKKTRGKKA